MAQSDTLIIHAALDGKAAVYRDIEIEASKPLYRLAEAIVSAFSSIMPSASIAGSPTQR
jgi:hypothetical protein